MLRHAMRLVLVLSLSLVACGDDDSPSSPAGDTTAPTVVSVTPADAATAVLRSTVVTIVFSEDVDASTVTAASVQLSSTAGAVATTLSTSGSTVTMTPTANLEWEATYTVTVTTAITDGAGNALAAGSTTSFTVKGQGPSLAGISPINGTIDHSVDTDVVVTFNDAVDASTITAATVNLSGPSGLVAGSLVVSGGGTIVTFDPAAALQFDTLYTVFIGRNIQDLEGDARDADFRTTFRTELAP